MGRVEDERDYWNAAAKDSKVIYDDWLTEQTYEVVKTFVNYDPHWAVFELGCGDGRLLNRLAQEYEGIHFLGVDVSAEMLKLASATAPSNAHYSLCDGRSLGIDFAEDSRRFSVAFCVTVFQHLPPEAVQLYINDVANSLDPIGRFLFQYIEGTEQEPFSHHYTKEQIAEWLANAGLTLVKTYQAVHDQWTWVEAQKI